LHFGAFVWKLPTDGPLADRELSELGQKQRIALARAVYRGADIFILDDVLAAVDVHVGRHLFKNCICGAMKGATRILATNALHVLPSCDSVSVVDNGTIAETGTYVDLVSREGGALAAMVESHTSKDVDEEPGDGTQDEPDGDALGGKVGAQADASTAQTNAVDKRTTAEKQSSGALVKEEVRKKGKVGLNVYRRYLGAGASDTTIFVLLIFGFIAPEGLSGGASVWLSVWTSAEGATGLSDVLFYLGVYAVMTLGAMSLVFGRAFMWAGVVVKAANKIHARLLNRVLRFPLNFFDVTPTGRILNRFAHDVDQVDTQISQALEQQMEWSLRGLAVGGKAIPTRPCCIFHQRFSVQNKQGGLKMTAPPV
jgi:ABC-type multidrug transport system fused ATPase/permease subunit